MNADAIRWGVIGVVLAILLSYAMVRPLIRKYRIQRDNIPEEKTKNVTCTVPACEVFYKRQNHDSRYCKFHDDVHKIYLKLVELNSPVQHRARVYFDTNGTFFKDEAKCKEILQDLQKHLDKVIEEKSKKPSTKKSTAPKKAPAKKATTPKKVATNKTLAKKAAPKKTVKKTTKK